MGKIIVLAEHYRRAGAPTAMTRLPSWRGEIYKKYRAQGLEIVALSFEEADQLKGSHAAGRVDKRSTESTTRCCSAATTDESEGKAGADAELGCLADDVLRGPRRTRPRCACGIPEQGFGRTVRQSEERVYRESGASSRRKFAQFAVGRGRQVRDLPHIRIMTDMVAQVTDLRTIS